MDCGDPGDPYGGYRNITTDTKYQSVVTYACNPDHHLEGEDSQVCQASGTWSGSKPVCLGRWQCVFLFVCLFVCFFTGSCVIKYQHQCDFGIK